MSNDPSQNRPPQWIDWLIRKLFPTEWHEDILGDLHERFELLSARLGPRQAKKRYIREAMAYFRPTFMTRATTPFNHPFPGDMIRHYWITAFRNMRRSKVFSAINVLGLSLGLTAFLLIFLWIDSEKQVDNFHENQSDLYSVYLRTSANGDVFGSYKNPYWFNFPETQNQRVLADELKAQFPEILYATSYATCYELPWGGPSTFQYQDIRHKAKGSTAGTDFFKMFSYPLLFGSAESALEEVNSIAISEQMATTFFGNAEKAIGKVLRYQNERELKVTAVFQDLKANSQLQFDYLISWKNMAKAEIYISDNKYPTYVQLLPGANPVLVAEKIKDFQNQVFDFSSDTRTDLHLQPYGDGYLVSEFENGHPTSGRIEYIRIFSGVAVFLLIIACINFMNLATARSLRRAKEVGVRKVVGSSRWWLVGQFIGEALLLSAIGMLFSLTLVKLVLPAFNHFTGKTMALPLNDLSYWAFIGAITLLVGIISGSYPAFFLSRLQPVRVFKGTLRFSQRSRYFRKGLSVFQFSLSILLLIATFVVTRQTSYVQNTQLGYDKENIIYVRVEGDLNAKYPIFKQELLQKPGIAMVDRSSEAPHNMGFEMARPFEWEGQEEGQLVSFKPTSVGYDFVDMMGLEVAEGRKFSKAYASDSTAFMVNETALKQMGMEAPLGKWISAWGKRGPIIGVLKDYHISSMHEAIKPLIVDVKEDLSFGIIMVKTEPGMTTEALESLQAISAQLNPNYPLDYQFLDQEYAQLYAHEAVISKLSNVFAGLAVAVSCIGLLGLAIFTSEQRVKEIGIRKVLGASVKSIVELCSREFILLVGLAFIVAAPVSWYLLDDWLQGFAYHIELSWWIFVLMGALTLAVAWLTVGYHVLKTALSNPVHSLRSE